VATGTTTTGATASAATTPAPGTSPETPSLSDKPGPALAGPTSGAGSAARPPSTGTGTPSRGTSAHRASRPAPVPPAPEAALPSVLPTTPVMGGGTGSPVVVSADGSGAPTAPLPATTAATTPAATGARPAAEEPLTPSEPVRRTSIRGAEARAAAVLTAGATAAGTTGTPAGSVPPADPDLPGTGPSDASVPYGDASAPTAPSTPEPVAPPHDDEPEGATAAPGGLRSRRGGGATASRPEPVRRPGGGAGRALLGVLVGLVVGAVGIWTVLFGQSRILGAQAPGWDASYDPLGVVLVTLGVAVLAGVLALGLWTPAVPVTAGLVATVAGVVLLYVPATTHVDVVRWVATDATRVSVTHATVTATSGTVFVLGALLLVAGLVLAVARRRWVPRG
jgi:hypothetical protein